MVKENFWVKVMHLDPGWSDAWTSFVKQVFKLGLLIYKINKHVFLSIVWIE